jgi:hypothetical protein
MFMIVFCEGISRGEKKAEKSGKKFALFSHSEYTNTVNE